VLQGAKKLKRIFFDKLNLLDNPLNFTPAWGGLWTVQESIGHTPPAQESASASVPLTEARELGE
jgi:hypothetical protein